MLAIVGGVPKVMVIKEVLNEFLIFRREIIINRTTFDLKEAERCPHSSLCAVLHTIAGQSGAMNCDPNVNPQMHNS